jgi:hypothetical protein
MEPKMEDCAMKMGVRGAWLICRWLGGQRPPLLGVAVAVMGGGGYLPLEPGCVGQLAKGIMRVSISLPREYRKAEAACYISLYRY